MRFTVFILALLVRIAAIETTGGEQIAFGDGPDYVSAATSLCERGVYPERGNLPFFRAPGLPFFIAAVTGCEPSRTRWIKYGLAVCDAVTALLIFLIALQVHGTRVAAAIAGVLAALHPFFIAGTTDVRSEPLFTVLLVGAIWFLLRDRDGRSERQTERGPDGQTERRLPAGRSAGFQPARIASTWELLHPTGRVERFPNHRTLFAAIAKLSSRASLFVQFPAPAELHDLQTADSPENADYILAGRLHRGRLEYAWVRPDAGRADRLKNGLPLRTAWTRHSMRDALLQLERIHGWQQLESPPAERAPYRLLLRRQDGGAHITGRTITGGTTYEIVLRADRQLPAEVPPRYYYAFTIDSHGRSYLAFPRSGSVENRFPLAAPAPPEIVLGRPSAFDVLPPYGVDTWFLLSTDEPLPDPWILQWEAVRAPRTLPSTWSIEKLVFESVPTR